LRRRVTTQRCVFQPAVNIANSEHLHAKTPCPAYHPNSICWHLDRRQMCLR
jgi:hypothetical protein